MFNEIYEDYKKQQMQSMKNFLGALETDGQVDDIHPKKNIDLDIILEKLDLINDDVDSFKIIEEYYEGLFKTAIIFGIGYGKVDIIRNIQEGGYELDKIKQINTEKLTDFTYTPEIDNIAEQFKINILKHGEW